MASKTTTFTDIISGINYDIELPILTDSEAMAYLNGKKAEIENVLYAKIQKLFPANTEVPVTEYLNYNIDTRKLFNMIIKWVYSQNTATIYGYKRESKITNELPASVYKVNDSEGTIDLTTVYTTDRILPAGGYGTVPSTNYYYKTGTDRWYVFKAVANNSLIDLPLISPYRDFPVYGGYGFNLIYYSSNTNSIKVCSVDKALGSVGATVHDPITWLSNVPGSKVSQAKPISPDEVDTTNEQVGNDVSYENIHIDVDVLTPTDDNEENFSTSTITDTNIVSIYALTNSEVRDFSTYIWSAASQGLWQALSEQLQNPMDVILSLHTIPYANSDGTFKFSTQPSNITLAGIDSGIASRKVLKDNFQDFVGSVNLTSFIRHNFVDFPPYTELSIYLPYLGYVDLDLNDFRDRVGDDDSLGLHYIVEPMTGNFIAKLTSFKKNYKGTKDDATSSLNGSVMYSFSGNMARQLPLANRHFDILGGLAGIGSSLLMGGVQATMAKKPIGGIVGGVAGAVGSVIDMMTPKVSHNGNLGGNFGYLDSNVARIIMRSTPYYIPSNYGLTTGYVINSYYSSFANLLGLVVIENWIPKNMSRATLEEITELEKLLKEGVYFGDGIWNETEEQESD